MNIINATLKIDNNTQDLYDITGKVVAQRDGMKEISGKMDVVLEDDDYQELMKPLNNQEEKSFYMDVDNTSYYVKDALFTSFDLNVSPDGTQECSIEFVAKDSFPAYMDIKFKNDSKQRKVKYGDGLKIRNLYGKLENMTYNEFKDHIMVEEL